MKKLFSTVFLALLLAVCLSVGVLAATAHTHDGVTFTAWTGSTALPTKAGSYYLTKDVSLSASWTVPSGTVRLCLNGHKITLTAATGSVIEVPTGSAFTLYDEDDAGLITGGKGHKASSGNDAYNSYGAGVYVAGTFTMNGGSISGNKSDVQYGSGGGVYVENGATFTMNGGVVSENEAFYDGGLYINGTFTMNGGEIRDHVGIGIRSWGSVYLNGGTVSGNDCGVSLYSSSMYMSGGVIRDNGCGISMQESDLDMSGGTVSGNSNDTEGGGIQAWCGSYITMSGGTISGNSSKTYGGGIYMTSDNFASSELTVTGGTISGNSASSGGGVYLHHDPDDTYETTVCTMTGGSIKNNSASSYGGGVFMIYSSFTLENGTISGNTAKSFSGGVRVMNNSLFTMNGGSIKNNTCTDSSSGGVTVAYTGSRFVMNGGTISGNTSKVYGAGVMLDQFGEMVMTGGSITGNSCSSSSDYGGGGGIYVDNSTSFSLSGNVIITGNTFNGADNNVCLESGSYITLGSNPLASGAAVGITTEDVPSGIDDRVVFTNSYNTSHGNESLSRFISDRIYDYDVVLYNSEAALCRYTTPKVITQPVSQSVVLGKTAKFSITAAGGGTLVYWWQYSDDGTTWNDCRSTGYDQATFSFKASSALDGRQYRCQVMTSYGYTWSDAAKLTVITAPTITTQPKAQTLAVGSTASFSVKTGGRELTYQWQYSDDGTTWKNCSSTGYNKATFSFKASTALHNRQYRCVVKNAAGSVNSSAAKLTVVGIKTQPSAQSVAAGSTATFKVVATGASSYQWQYSDNGTTWTNCKSTGYNKAAFSFTASSALNSRQYRCQIKNGSITVNSNAAKLTVTAAKPTITTQPKNVTVALKSSTTFKVVASGTGLSYQWQYSKNNGASWTTWSGKTSASLAVTASTTNNGCLYRCVVKNSAGSVTSSTARLTVSGVKPTILTQPTAASVSAGTKVSFKVVAAGTNLTYQWQYSDNGTTWTNCKSTGCNTATFTFTASASLNGRQYRCVVKNSYGSATSSAGKLTVK